MKKIKEKIETISKFPLKESYIWKGKPSIVTSIVAWLLWFCRLFSLLQICKFVFRVIKKKIYVLKDKTTKVDVPSYFTELYFIIELIVACILKMTNQNNTFITIISIYFFIESFIWVIYYTIARRFYEPVYTIYSPLEYFIMLIIVVPCMAFNISIFKSNEQFSRALKSLLGDGSNYLWLFIIGTLMTSIIIGTVVSNFPVEFIKSNTYISIIGAGDNTKDRLLPNVIKDEDINDYRIYDLDNKFCMKKCFVGDMSTIDNKLLEDKSEIFFVEVPPQYHLHYLELLLSSKTSLIALEKPACIDPYDLRRFYEIMASDNANNIFLISYYLLEKMLPLTYLFTRREYYLKYLTGDIEKAKQLHSSAGNIKSIEISIIEKEDNRSWASDLQWYETMIHPLIIASNILDCTPDKWQILKFESDNNSWIINAKYNDTDINLLVVKSNDSEVKRIAKIVYDNLNIVMDVDLKTLSIGQASISINTKYKNKYSIIYDMVKHCYQDKINPSLIDGRKYQLEIIDWLNQMNKDKL